MRDMHGIATALIFRSPALFISEAGLGSKNRRLENITLFGAQRVALAQTFFGFSH